MSEREGVLERKIVCEREKGLRDKERVRERRTMLENPTPQNVNKIEQVCNKKLIYLPFSLLVRLNFV